MITISRYQQFRRSVIAMLWKRDVRIDRCDVDDLLHDALLLYINRAPSDVVADSFRSMRWINVVVWRLHLRKWRGGRIIRTVVKDDQLRSSNESDIEAEKRIVGHIIGSLSPSLQQVFQLYYEGYRRIDIAEHLGLSLVVVNKRITRALQQLRLILQQDGVYREYVERYGHRRWRGEKKCGDVP